MPRKTQPAAQLWAIVGLLETVLKIGGRRLTEAERASLNEVRKAKILQDISISRTRQQALITNTAIHVRRSSHKVEQDARKVELADLQIEIQRLKVLEMQRKLGITSAEFKAENYSLDDYTAPGMTKYNDRKR